MTGCRVIGVLLLSCLSGFSQSSISGSVNTVASVFPSQSNNTFLVRSSVNSLLTTTLPGVTNLAEFNQMCRQGDYIITILASRTPFNVIDEKGQLKVVVDVCREVQIRPVSLPVMAIVTQKNVLVVSYDKLVSDITKIDVLTKSGGLESDEKKSELIELQPPEQVILTEDEVIGNKPVSHKQVGSISRSRFVRFCKTLELLNIRWMKDSTAFSSNGPWREIRISREKSLQVLKWPMCVEDQDEVGDVSCSAISLMIDGLMKEVRWK